MKSFIALMFILILGGSQALNCYTCHDCKDNVGSSKSCISGVHDVCMTMTFGDKIMVMKDCGLTQVCNMKLGEGSGEPFPGMADLLKTLPKGLEIDIDCCDSDYCNAGMTNLSSVSIILLSLVLVALFMS